VSVTIKSLAKGEAISLRFCESYELQLKTTKIQIIKEH